MSLCTKTHLVSDAGGESPTPTHSSAALGALLPMTVRDRVGQDWPDWTVDLSGPHSGWFAYFDI